MNIQLGVFQEQEQIDQYLAAKGIGHNDIQIAGPFPSRLQAVQWMDFIEKKSGQGPMERHAVGLMNKKPWYGLTFTPKPAAAVKKRIPPLFTAMSAGLR